MRCPICHHPLEAGATTCPECGTGILPPPAPGAEPTPFVRRQAAPRWPLVLSVVGIVAALVVIAIALIPLLGGDDDDGVVGAGPASTTSTVVPSTVPAVASSGAPSTALVTTTAPPTTAPPTTEAPTDPPSTVPVTTPPTTTPDTTGAPATSPVATAPGFPVALPVSLVEASCTAPDSTDSRGKKITFNPLQMIDGNPDTAWRCPGDAKHQVLVFTLEAPSDVTVVGALPGWAGTDPYLNTDRFHQNRRVTKARWMCLDASSKEVASAEQTFADRAEVQHQSVDGFTGCVKVGLEILDASRPGGRDFTAVAEVEILGPSRS